MYRILSVLVSAWILQFCASAANADITYDVIPFQFPSGWTIDESTITTDGTLGSINESNFTAYSLRFTTPNGTFAFNEFNSFPIYFDQDDASGLFADPTELSFVAAPSLTISDQLIWSQTGGPIGPFVGISGAAFGTGGFLQLGDGQSVVQYDEPAVARTFTFARVHVVPEPSATVTGLCGATLFLSRRRRRNGLGSTARV